MLLISAEPPKYGQFSECAGTSGLRLRFETGGCCCKTRGGACVCPLRSLPIRGHKVLDEPADEALVTSPR